MIHPSVTTKEKKIIVLSCMHGRNKTVKYCLDKMPFIDKVMIYTSDHDGVFLNSTDVVLKKQFKNSPLSFKWNAGIEALKDIDFDAVIILGSDDYVEEGFVEYVRNNIEGFDMIGFKDIYFERGSERFYWPGYKCNRVGEPIGAGRVYTKEFLERIQYNLFNKPKERGLDGVSWKRSKEMNVKVFVTSLVENNLFMCDVKDGLGITPLRNIPDLVRI